MAELEPVYEEMAGTILYLSPLARIKGYLGRGGAACNGGGGVLETL